MMAASWRPRAEEQATPCEVSLFYWRMRRWFVGFIGLGDGLPGFVLPGSAGMIAQLVACGGACAVCAVCAVIAPNLAGAWQAS